MLEDLAALLRAVLETETAVKGVSRHGWKKAAALEAALRQNQCYLGTGAVLIAHDERGKARVNAIMRARVYRESYEEALQRSDQPIFQTVAVGHAKLLGHALADLRNLIPLQRL